MLMRTKRFRAIMESSSLALLLFLLHTASSRQQQRTDVDPQKGLLSRSSYSSDRKLLVTGQEGEPEGQTDRIGDACSREDLALYQAATTPLPSGIPTYTVHIINVCITGCSISDVHVACGWFSTARTINPTVFRRLRYNDCLVNDGKPIPSGESLSFQYANTRPYPLFVSSVVCVS